jgi:hypothetical protein
LRKLRVEVKRKKLKVVGYLPMRGEEQITGIRRCGGKESSFRKSF